ncbi:MAG: hypothetical protein KDD50_11510 [Bdellovibrionales bacterium]|nr:hypothetical protein [Bdellovibrionales bacterium]
MNMSQEKPETLEVPFSGYSMWPTFAPQQKLTFLLFTQPKPLSDFNESEFQEGDILLSYENKEWVAHRLLIHKNKKILKGDSSLVYNDNNNTLIFAKCLNSQSKLYTQTITNLSKQLISAHLLQRKFIRLKQYFISWVK